MYNGENSSVTQKKENSKKKISDKEFVVPTFCEFDKLKTYNYRVSQLQKIARKYKQKISGNKSDLLSNIYNFLYRSHYACIIQTCTRGYLVKMYMCLRGPALMKRFKCTNDTDFYSLEKLEDVERNQFFSYSDSDGFVYGFDVLSIFQLFTENKMTALNPYNRERIPQKVYENIKRLNRISKVVGMPLRLTCENEKKVSKEKQMQLRILSLFQYIDESGHCISNPDWFESLTREGMVKFFHELYDIWNYRAELSEETKRLIYPPGRLYRNINMNSLNNLAYDHVKKINLGVMESLVKSGLDENSRNLGCLYVLTALTLVSREAAETMPWLFESVA